MSAIELMKSRRSIRSFKSEMLSDEIIDKIIEAGLWAASGKNCQDAIIIKVTDKAVRDEISAVNCEIGGWEKGFDPFYGAPVILIVLAKRDNYNADFDGSLVMGNLMLAAHELGIGSIWINRAKQEFNDEWGKEFLKKHGIEGDYTGIAHCALGYIAGDYPKEMPRKDGRVFEIK